MGTDREKEAAAIREKRETESQTDTAAHRKENFPHVGILTEDPGPEWSKDPEPEAEAAPAKEEAAPAKSSASGR